MGLSVPSNMWSNRAAHWVLLCSSVVPPLPQLSGKLAGEPADVPSLRITTAANYKVDEQPKPLFMT